MSQNARVRLRDRARRVKMLIFDVDGVMTDGHVVLDGCGREIKFFHVHDGVGIEMAHRAGLRTAVITQRLCAATTRRARELGISEVLGGKQEKETLYENLLRKHGLRDAEAAYMGDDLPDVAILRRVGLAVCPASARAQVKRHCHLVTASRGGEGAVREAIERILRLRRVSGTVRRLTGVLVTLALLLKVTAELVSAKEDIRGFAHRDFDKGRLLREIAGNTATWADEKTVVVKGLKVRDYTLQGVWELEAEEGKVNTKNWDADCRGNVRLSSSSGEEIQADELVWKNSKRRMIAKGNVHAVLRARRITEEKVAGPRE